VRKFSRWMPPLPPQPPPNTTTQVLLAVIIGGLLALVVGLVGWAFVSSPVCTAMVILAILLSLRSANGEADREARRLLKEWRREDIGSFARGFDRRSEPFDPWVVRATWDAMKMYMRIPLRPTDRFVKDFGIVDEEIDMALLDEVAERSGHSLEDLARNPYYAKLSSLPDFTIGDFVRLISWQPVVESSKRSS
jgi:hypothetical protein